MKKLAVLLLVIGSLLSGCIPFEGPNRGGAGYHSERDHDRDGDRRESHDHRY
jgi:hypothetical protein